MQTWNGLISYIKRKLGSPINLLEITDDDIHNIVVEDVIPHISQYVGKPIWVRINSSHLKPNTHSGGSYNEAETYIIPIPDNITVIDIHEVYWHQQYFQFYNEPSFPYLSMMDPRDAVIHNAYIDMYRDLDIVPTFRFIPPKEVLFDVSLKTHDIILETKCVHSDLSTIPADVYIDLLKPLALAEVLETIVAFRKKYRNVSTPFGNIELNWEELQSEARDLKQIVEEKLDAMPPDVLIGWV